MPPQALVERVERLEQRVAVLEELPPRVDDLTSQFSQLRAEMGVEFSAVRAEMYALAVRLEGRMDAGYQAMRVEMQTLHDTLAARLEARIDAGDADTRLQMQILHEELISRLALLHEGELPTGPVRPRKPRRRR